jgi:hypothetical protein
MSSKIIKQVYLIRCFKISSTFVLTIKTKYIDNLRAGKIHNTFFRFSFCFSKDHIHFRHPGREAGAGAGRCAEDVWLCTDHLQPHTSMSNDLTRLGFKNSNMK